MDTMKLGNLDIHLPYVARDLCREAVTLADSLRGNVSDEELQKYLDNFVETFLSLLPDIAANGIPNFGFDHFNLESIPESMLDEDPDLSKLFAKFPGANGLRESMLAAEKDGQDLHSAAMLLIYVDLLREIEDQAIKASKSDYKTVTAATSQYVLFLNQIMLTVKSQPSQAKVYVTKLQRVRGARKGGAAKANRLKDLRDLVLQEARQNFAGIPATKAAKAIYQKLSAQGNWLQDENGKMLLADPETRFTAWIREDKAENSA